ncbi:MAG: ribosome maturation factor RimM [Muribaculaceae bacterium]|nr:ribosome maturation factor RimM [Muribaculaceae bacterium]
MIARSEVADIGNFGKPHGVKGEIAATFEPEMMAAVEAVGHFFVELDGLLVPFFISGVRPKGSETLLLTIKGVASEPEAARFAGKAIYVEKSLLPEGEDDIDEDGNFYLDDLIGFTIVDDGRALGTVADYDDSTENVLFVVDTPRGELLVPAADDLIDEVDVEHRTISMTLPQGLIE